MCWVANVIVWDIETVPDIKSFAIATKVLAKPEMSTMLGPSHADAPNPPLSKST
jgi:hypothetical protein